MASPYTEVTVGELTVRVSHPDRVYFSTRGETKLDLVNYYLAVSDGIVRALRERPCMLHRFPSGDRKSTRLNSSHSGESRMPSSA